MRKKLIVLLLLTAFLVVVGCGHNIGYSFGDLAQYRFEFASGAGGWSTELFIEKDGSFHGNYHDSEMGSYGEGYENGTIYSSVFHGKFKELSKISPLCYEFKLDTVSYENEVGTEEILDETLYKYTEWYGLEGTEIYKVYLPGTPISELSEEVYNWVRWANNSEEELTIPIIVNEPMQYGIYSYERLSPYEDAEMNYQNYKSSYDYFYDCYQNAQNTFEMHEAVGSMHETADICLNYIWDLIRYNVDETEFEQILEEQRNWNVSKEQTANAAAAEYAGGTLEGVVYSYTLAEETMARCKELVEYLE